MICDLERTVQCSTFVKFSSFKKKTKQKITLNLLRKFGGKYRFPKGRWKLLTRLKLGKIPEAHFYEFASAMAFDYWGDDSVRFKTKDNFSSLPQFMFMVTIVNNTTKDSFISENDCQWKLNIYLFVNVRNHSGGVAMCNTATARRK